MLTFLGKAIGWNDEFEGPYICENIVEVEVRPTVISKNCDTEVDNLCLPPVSKECPPWKISSLMEGGTKYNAEPILYDCVFHIVSELKLAGLITEEERVSIMSCNHI